jgi:thioredoxin reductase
MSHAKGSAGQSAPDYDVAIVGGGPAGLSAAIVLGRARRRVLVCDHGKPRNYAARAIHGYLGIDGISPAELRQRGGEEARRVGVEILAAEVTAVVEKRLPKHKSSRFEVSIAGRPPIVARKLLLATGLIDVLPDTENVRDFYGTSVHHCPYCDGWEHRGKRLVALGDGKAAVGLAISLRGWSPHVVACTNGQPIGEVETERLARNHIGHRAEKVVSLSGASDSLEAVHFDMGPPLACDALFFHTDKHQRSPLPAALGCEYDEDGLVITHGKQGTGVPGLFLAGDSAGHVQFAIVAAAEGAIAATAIHRELQLEDFDSGR